MVSCALLVLGPLWIHGLVQACSGEELCREAVVSWFRERVLEGLGLEEPPGAGARGPHVRHLHRRVPRTSRMAWAGPETSTDQETSQIILFPSSDSSCVRSDSERHFTSHFQPSVNSRDTLVTSAHFWFHAGDGASGNSSAPLFVLTSGQQLLQAAEAPAQTTPDGWATYRLGRRALASVAEGPFLLQVRCPACRCRGSEPDKTPFLHLHARPRGPARLPRHATIPWSPSALDLLQRPSPERPQHGSCQRAAIEISFEELGWDNWIVHPTSLTFYYCHGNCSAPAMLRITQCCTPVPGTMRPLRIITTSDGGYSFKYETLPNILPEECTCI